MESFSFELRLIDGVTASVKKAAKSVEDFGVKARKIQESVDSSWNKISDTLNKNAAKTQASAQSMGKAHSAAIVANGKLEAATKRQTERAVQKQNAVAASISKSHSVALGMNEKLEKAVQSRGDRTTAIAIRNSAKQEISARRLGLAHVAALKENERLDKKSGGGGLFSWASPHGGGRIMSAAFGEVIAESFMSGAKIAVDFIANGVKEAFKAATGEETQRITEKSVLGAKGAEAFRADIDRFADKTAFDDDDIRRMMMPARKAGIGQDAARQMFATASDLGGGDEGATSSMMENFRKLYTKHGASKKSLVPILEEAGLSVPEFYAALGKKLKISAKEAEKRAEGDIDPQLAMNIVTEATNKRQGGMGGTTGVEYGESMAAMWKKLTNLPSQYYKQLFNSPGYSQAKKAVAGILKDLDPKSANGKKVMNSLAAAFTQIVGLVSRAFTTENIDKFSALLASACDGAGAFAEKAGKLVDVLIELPGTISSIVTAVELLGVALIAGKILFNLDAMLVALPGIATAAGASAAAVGTVVAPLLLVAAAIIATVEALRQLDEASKEFDPKKVDKMAGISDKAIQERADSQTIGTARGRLAKGLELTDTESGALQRRGIDEGQFRKSVVVNAPVNISIAGGDPEKVKKAVVDGVSHALAPAGHVTERSAGESS